MIGLRRWLGAAIALIMLAGPASAAEDAKLPSYVVFGGTSGGGLLGTIASGIGKLVSDKTPMEVRMRLVTGALDPLVDSGEVQFATSVSVEAYQSTRGTEHYKGRPQKGLRVVVGGPLLVTGFIVRKDSPVQTIADLKGRKVLGEFPGTRPIYFDVVATLAAAGMTWKDVKVVPAADLIQNVQLFMQGRAEAGVGVIGAGFMQEIDTNLKGIRFVGLPTGPDIAQRMRTAVPGYFPVAFKAGSALGIDRDLSLAAKDIYIAASTKTDGNAVYVLTKTLWNDIADLHAVHPIFRTWIHARMLNDGTTIPYHDAAIRFFKEIDVWTPSLQAHQEAMLREIDN